MMNACFSFNLFILLIVYLELLRWFYSKQLGSIEMPCNALRRFITATCSLLISFFAFFYLTSSLVRRHVSEKIAELRNHAT